MESDACLIFFHAPGVVCVNKQKGGTRVRDREEKVDSMSLTL